MVFLLSTRNFFNFSTIGPVLDTLAAPSADVSGSSPKDESVLSSKVSVDEERIWSPLWTAVPLGCN